MSPYPTVLSPNGVRPADVFEVSISPRPLSSETELDLPNFFPTNRARFGVMPIF